MDKSAYLQKLQALFADYSVYEDTIIEAVDFAIYAHEWQRRKYDNLPYVTHPMAVSLDVAEKYHDIELIIAALLHDAVEDCEAIHISDVANRFWPHVAFLVEAVTEEPLYFISEPDVVFGDKIEKMLAGGMRDVRVLLLKIADRDHNLSTLWWLQPNKQVRMTFETQAIYEPLREILAHQDFNIEHAAEQFRTYCLDHNLVSVAEIKHNLFNQTFYNFDHNTFLLAYKNTNAIVRQSDDKKRFEKLLSSPKFDSYIDVISMRTDGDKFSATFIFKAGKLFQDKSEHKFKLSNFLSD